eukprot:scaffold16650_cov38-Cyclotella_meneghiniana.AAC.5
MSDLAPFVAAQLRDKVVTDLLEENKRLRDQLNNAYQVRITSDNGNTLATAALTSGTWRSASVFWDVQCDKAEENYWPISVFLENMGVQIGELMYARSGLSEEESRYVYMDERSWDGDNRKEVQMVFLDNSPWGFSLIVRIDGWPRIHWSDIQHRSWSTRGSENQLDVFEVLKSEVVTSYPDAKVSIVEISFRMNDVLQMMFDNLGMPPLSQEELRKQKKKKKISGIIAQKLREAGNTDLGDAFFQKLHELEALLFVIGLEEPNEEMEHVLPKLIELQNNAAEMESEFAVIELVMEEYSISKDEFENRWNLFYGVTCADAADGA